MSIWKEREEATIYAKSIAYIEGPLSDFTNDLFEQYIEGTIETDEMLKKIIENYTTN